MEIPSPAAGGRSGKGSTVSCVDRMCGGSRVRLVLGGVGGCTSHTSQKTRDCCVVVVGYRSTTFFPFSASTDWRAQWHGVQARVPTLLWMESVDWSGHQVDRSIKITLGRIGRRASIRPIRSTRLIDRLEFSETAPNSTLHSLKNHNKTKRKSEAALSSHISCRGLLFCSLMSLHASPFPVFVLRDPPAECVFLREMGFTPSAFM